jgi:putative endonuclease
MENCSLVIIIFGYIMNLLKYCVYVLFSEKDQQFYIGYTTNLENRLENHHSGKTTSTSYRRPLKLIFCEYYLFEQDAMNRELYFKTSAGRRALNLMLRTTLERLGYNSSNKKAN